MKDYWNGYAILKCAKKDVSYFWIPPHVNITGNEEADSTTNLTISSTSTINDESTF